MFENDDFIGKLKIFKFEFESIPSLFLKYKIENLKMTSQTLLFLNFSFVIS